MDRDPSSTDAAPPAGSNDRGEVSSRATVIDESPAPGDGGAAQGEARRLAEAYDAIIAEREIPYPVPYRLVRELGKGRQGIVFLAVRQGGRGCLTRHAVKLFNPAIYSTAERYWADMARVAAQVSQLQPIHSDCLVSRDVYDECRGIGYIQMTAIDGLDLQYLLSPSHLAIARSQSTDDEWRHFMNVLFRLEHDRFALQPGIAIYILRRILVGLDVMHSAGFLHGDVKPSNVMVDRHGSVKLVDFGRAAVIGERVSILLGSPLYMAPEIHNLEPGVPQSDIYSAGLVGAEMLRGSSIVDPAITDEPELMERKRTLLTDLGSAFPSYVRENDLLMSILTRMLQPEPRHRFRNALEAEGSSRGLRGVHRQLAHMGMDAEYDRELQTYLAKLADPATGHLNPYLD